MTPDTLRKHNIDLKANINETDVLLNNFASKLMHIHPDYFIPGFVQIFSHSIQYIGGPKIKVSTVQYPLTNIHDCIAEFNGKLEHYGNPRVSYIPIIQTLKFSDLNEDSLNIIKLVENDMNILFNSKPSRMSTSLWLDFESLIPSFNEDELNKIEDKKSKLLNYLAKMGSNINQAKRIKYMEVCKILKAEKSKPKKLRDFRLINSKTSLANYYVRRYNIPRRHFSTNTLDFEKLNTEIMNEYYTSTTERYNNMKSKYKNYESFIDREFINSIKNKTLKSRHFIVAADFETVIHEDKHYVFCSSIYFKYHKKNKDSLSDVVTINNYIEHTSLKSDLSNIELLSNDLLLTFWQNLVNIKTSYFYKADVPIFYFHNMDKFDGVFILKIISLLLDNSTLKPDDVSIIQRNNILYQIKINDITIRDSLHIIPGSLDSLAKTFLKDTKQKIDIIFNYDSIINNVNNITEYCEHDSYLLYEVISAFRTNIINLYNTDPISVLTISSLSFKILRKFFIKDRTIENTSNNVNKHEFIHKSYRGGYCGVLIPMEEEYKLTHIDINSSYPSSMTLDLPTKHGVWVKSMYLELMNDNIDYINSNGLKLFGFFDVLIKVETTRALSPLIIRYNSKLTDVTGLVRVTIFSEELNFILNNGGTLIELYSGLVYESSRLLEDFARTLYTKRKSTTNDTEQLIYKLILNSAYGRFALKDSMEVSALTTNEHFDIINTFRSTSNEISIGEKHTMFNIHRNDETRNIDLIKVDNHLNKVVNMKISSRALRGIQIASAITSYGRINLLSMCYKIEDLGGKIFYVDTDSIYTDLSPELVKSIGNISDQLGDWKIENTNLRGIFIQPKFYITDSLKDSKKIKLKSIPKHAIRKLEVNKAVWELFKSRLYGTPLIIKTDKYFLRNMGDQSINVRKNIEFILGNRTESKRTIIMDNDRWIKTESLCITYDSTLSHRNTYKTDIDNPIIFKIQHIINEFSQFLKLETEGFSYNLNTTVACITSSYELARYEIKILLSYSCTHKVRLIMRVDGKVLSSPFKDLHDALEFIADVEERYKYMELDWIKVVSKIADKDDLHLFLVAISFGSLLKACGPEISIDDASFMLRSFIKVLKDPSNVRTYENYYEYVHDNIVTQTVMILKTLDHENSDKSAMLRQFIINEIITGIGSTSSSIQSELL